MYRLKKPWEREREKKKIRKSIKYVTGIPQIEERM